MKKNTYRFGLYSFAVSVILVSVNSYAFAAKTSTPQASSTSVSSSVVQSYSSGPSVLPGMIVELEAKSQSTVEPLPSKDILKMLGVVIPSGQANLVLTPQTSSAQQVYVAVSGAYDVLVSNQNGSIKPGDYLTISALSGVAMKADSTQTEIIGRAVGSFNGSSNVISAVSLKNDLGHTITTSISRISVEVHLGQNPLYQNSNYIPSFLSKTASGVADKPVSSARIYLGAALLIVTLFVTASMIYSGIRTGITAVGRNPLAKKSIALSLIQTLFAVLIILASGVFTTYLILKL